MNVTPSGQRYTVRGYSAFPGTHGAILDLPDELFDRYDNPFERKATLRSKRDLPSSIENTIAILETQWLEDASHEFGIKLRADTSRHFCGVFKYEPGDRLGVHVDAGIHPLTGERKHVTAVLYLGGVGADLELWSGERCDGENAKPYAIVAKIPPVDGRLVLFENNDYAWHGVGPETESDLPRVVVTVSYVSDEVDAFHNKRKRAFFAPRPSETWDAAIYALRDYRAGEQAASVYRA